MALRSPHSSGVKSSSSSTNLLIFTASPSASSGKDLPSSNQNAAENYIGLTHCARCATLVIIALFIVFKEPLQARIDDAWEVLKVNPLFCSAYFETFYVTVTYALVMIFYPYAMHYIPFLQRFKVSGDVTYVHRNMLGRDGLIAETVSYLATYSIADAFKMKRYFNVSEIEWEKRRHQWIQTTRALPDDSPDVFVMCLKVMGALFIFDLFFFIIHYTLHNNFFLYKYVHSRHHDHETMHPHVTNQLSVIEQILQVSSANYSLILLRCHPLTRVVFVPFYIWFLVENHTGYDLPWAPHRILPRGWMGGPAKHHDHHLHGHRNYQPLFNYLDNWLVKRRQIPVPLAKW